MPMRKIYLFCSSGMSTSLLAKRMQEAADAHGLPVIVGAYSSAQIDEVVGRDAPDCILLGPQVRFMRQQVEERYGERIPVGVIDARDYGSVDGERVLKAAVLLLQRGPGGAKA